MVDLFDDDLDDGAPSLEELEVLIAAAEAEFGQLADGQAATLSYDEQVRAEAVLAKRRSAAWMMSVHSENVEEPDPLAVLAQLINRPAWHQQAACRGGDPALFVQDRVPPLKRHTRAAQAYCATCPVREQCVASALEAPWVVGVWGGTTAKGRKQMR